MKICEDMAAATRSHVGTCCQMTRPEGASEIRLDGRQHGGVLARSRSEGASTLHGTDRPRQDEPCDGG